jgi:hypothetical protein
LHPFYVFSNTLPLKVFQLCKEFGGYEFVKFYNVKVPVADHITMANTTTVCGDKMILD